MSPGPQGRCAPDLCPEPTLWSQVPVFPGILRIFHEQGLKLTHFVSRIYLSLKGEPLEPVMESVHT